MSGTGGQKRTPAKKAAAKKVAAKKAAPKKAPIKKKAPVRRPPPRVVEEEYEYEDEAEYEEAPQYDDRRQTRRVEDRWGTWDKRIRDLLIFMLGLGVIVNEVWVEGTPRLPGLVAGFALIGIPLTLYADEQRRARP